MTRGFSLFCLLSVGLLVTVPAMASPAALFGAWRFTHSLPAPWGAPLAGSADFTGKILRLQARTMNGPAPLDCGGVAQLESTRYPAEALFQGNLPDPAMRSAQSLGFSQRAVEGLRVSCDKGTFEFHQVDSDTVLLGLDNRVWTLSRAAGTRAAAASAAGRVEVLLERHFGDDMSFNAVTAQAKVPLQSRVLNRLMAAYLAKSRPRDEVPPIDGDPYTDSQEYPTRFAVGTAQMHRGRALVPVRLADAWRQRVITFELVREDGHWRLDDLDYGPGGRLSALLRQ